MRLRAVLVSVMALLVSACPAVKPAPDPEKKSCVCRCEEKCSPPRRIQ